MSQDFLSQDEITELLGLDTNEDIFEDEKLVSFKKKLLSESYSKKEIIIILKAQLKDMFLEYPQEWIIPLYEKLDNPNLSIEELKNLIENTSYEHMDGTWHPYVEQIKKGN